MTNGEGEVICTCLDKEIAESFIKDVESVKDLLPNEQGELIDKLKQLRFFNQRAGRELWGDKPREMQDKDIENADTILSMAISALSENKGEWIPIKDQLPKDGEEVLVSLTPNGVHREKVEMDCFMMSDIKYWRSGKVEAWMPKPEPYKAESEETE